VALGLGVIGTALLVAAPSGSSSAPSVRFLAGALLAPVAGLAYALYVLVAKVSLRRSAPLPMTTLTFTIGAFLLTPALVWTEAPLAQVALLEPLTATILGVTLFDERLGAGGGLGALLLVTALGLLIIDRR